MCFATGVSGGEARRDPSVVTYDIENSGGVAGVCGIYCIICLAAASCGIGRAILGMCELFREAYGLSEFN